LITLLKRGAMLSRGEGRDEVKDDTCLRLERILPRVVITLAHPVREASPNISPANAKRKCEELAQGPKENFSERQNVVRKLVAALENRGKYPPLSLTELPSLVFRQILEFLPHSALLNLSLTNSALHFLVMEEWQTNPSLWRHVTLASSLAPSKLLSLKNALQEKRRFIRSIRVSDGADFLSEQVFDSISSVRHLRRIVVQSKVKHQHIIRILSSFPQLQSVELTKLGMQGTVCNYSPPNKVPRLDTDLATQ